MARASFEGGLRICRTLGPPARVRKVCATLNACEGAKPDGGHSKSIAELAMLPFRPRGQKLAVR